MLCINLNVNIFNVPKFKCTKFSVNIGGPKEEQSIIDHGQARRATGNNKSVTRWLAYLTDAGRHVQSRFKP